MEVGATHRTDTMGERMNQTANPASSYTTNTFTMGTVTAAAVPSRRWQKPVPGDRFPAIRRWDGREVPGEVLDIVDFGDRHEYLGLCDDGELVVLSEVGTDYGVWADLTSYYRHLPAHPE